MDEATSGEGKGGRKKTREMKETSDQDGGWERNRE